MPARLIVEVVRPHRPLPLIVTLGIVAVGLQRIAVDQRSQNYNPHSGMRRASEAALDKLPLPRSDARSRRARSGLHAAAAKLEGDDGSNDEKRLYRTWTVVGAPLRFNRTTTNFAGSVSLALRPWCTTSASMQSTSPVRVILTPPSSKVVAIAPCSK